MKSPWLRLLGDLAAAVMLLVAVIVIFGALFAFMGG